MQIQHATYEALGILFRYCNSVPNAALEHGHLHNFEIGAAAYR
jgi:hypothetical protein